MTMIFSKEIQILRLLGDIYNSEISFFLGKFLTTHHIKLTTNLKFSGSKGNIFLVWFFHSI